mgnify:CR=1 FL=1
MHLASFLRAVGYFAQCRLRTIDRVHDWVVCRCGLNMPMRNMSVSAAGAGPAGARACCWRCGNVRFGSR